MNKLKEELRFKLLGQLSDDKTELDINNAYEVCVKFAVSFSLFCAENYNPKKVSTHPIIWEGYQNTRFTTEELLNLYLGNGTL